MGITTGTCIIGPSPAARFVLDSADALDSTGCNINMNTLSGREVLEAVGGLLTWGGRKVDFKRVCTDSRKALPGDVFFALVGERFDGHKFIPAALANGAAGVVYQHGRYAPEPVGDAWAIEVPDTLAALGDLAAYYRRKQLVRVVGITGSVGKTTVRAMVSHLLASFGSVVASPKSFNNAIGVPLTLFQIEPQHDYAVVEMGTNAPGEIRRLAEIARPDVAVITAVEPVHVEGLGGMNGIACEKADITRYMDDAGVLVTNGDNEWCREIARRFPGEVITFGMSPECTVFATDVERFGGGIRFALQGERAVVLDGVHGKHNVHNALAAAAVGWHFGRTVEEIADAFVGCELPPMRMEVVRVGQRTCLLDCYNANPCSLAAGLDELAQMTERGPKAAVLADMAELGDIEEPAHDEAGRRVAELGLDAFVAVGERMGRAADAAVAAGMPAAHVHRFATSADAAEAVESLLPEKAVFLLKGSRCMELEVVFERLKKNVN